MGLAQMRKDLVFEAVERREIEMAAFGREDMRLAFVESDDRDAEASTGPRMVMPPSRGKGRSSPNSNGRCLSGSLDTA